MQLPAGPQPLDAWISADPTAALGSRVTSRFGPRLPYLLKVLAAAAPLSLQVHPSMERAAQGFAEEEAAGIAHTARERRYKDPFHKPEMIIAVSRFEALCGLRDLSETIAMLVALPVAHPGWGQLLEILDTDDEPAALRAAFEMLLHPDSAHAALVDAVTQACDERRHTGGPWADVDATVVELAKAYPGDPGVVVALLLNRLTLEPGEALYLPDGNVHAYLSGTGIEVMASSDNVLRAGLTAKYVDIDELMSVVDFHPRPHPFVEPSGDPQLMHYRPGAAEFEVASLRLADARQPVDVTGPRIVLCLEGAVTVSGGVAGAEAGDCGSQQLTPGRATFVPGSDPAITVAGTGWAVVVSVPDQSG